MEFIGTKDPSKKSPTMIGKQFMRHKTEEGGYTAWNVYNDFQNSSARTEVGTALMAMQPKTEINIGIDNATTVQIGNAIIEHRNQKGETKLKEKHGGLRLRGNISKLHRPTPFRRL